jgi:galactokinase/mevalonate kinase-like predicted kinase
MPDRVPVQHLLTLPPGMARVFESLEDRPRPSWFATSDPAGSRLGSGGGTANLLAEAWHATGTGESFGAWLRSAPKLIVHGGGQSRRLPAYAAMGKSLMPIPVFRWSRGQRLDQTLLDLQLPDYRRVLEHGPASLVAMVAAGDVILRFGPSLPPFPEVDVLGLGMLVRAETAKDHGVFLCPRSRPDELEFFLQKPDPERLADLSEDYVFLVDTGMWLLSERAVDVLMRKAGWDGARFAAGGATGFELYAELGLALGRNPTAPDPALEGLTSAVVPLPEAAFHHFGSSRQLIESTSALQNLVFDGTSVGLTGARHHPDVYQQNARFEAPLRLERNHTLWIENSVIPATWQLTSGHVLTGIPANAWSLQLQPGACLDVVPLGDEAWCLRPYDIDDPFAGAVGAPGTRWMGDRATAWFEARGLAPADAGVDPAADIQRAPLFPVVDDLEAAGDLVAWMLASAPDASSDATVPEPAAGAATATAGAATATAGGAADAALAARWLASERMSAWELGERANLGRLYAQRLALARAALQGMLEHAGRTVFYRLDLDSTARLFAASGQPLPAAPSTDNPLDPLDPLVPVHAEMFRSAVMRRRGDAGWEGHEAAAFARLRDLIVRESRLSAVIPRRDVLDDQIVWARSPVRLDLAGGWSDTPPYCIEYGGRVVNLAVDLNGQPPIQVFAKTAERAEIVLRSIDQGTEERVRTWDDLAAYADAGSDFGLAKAALALAGFLPAFNAGPSPASLEEQLRAFGGGIELSMLCAVPKGSGLGTSSVLAATLLAALGDLCGLGWDQTVLFTRTLALEQLLTTGGGWQDQAGGIYHGVKLVETTPGLAQRPLLRWLPGELAGPGYANRSMLLYYTGLTRLAKGILQDVVRGIFLNSPAHIGTIAAIAANAGSAVDAFQRCDYDELARVVDRSWRLNQQLDPGTNTPEVQAILERVEPWLAGGKLLGAGGGGYLVLLARDADAGRRIRQTLEGDPPNRRARFVDFSVSPTGLQVTRS